MFLRPAKAFLIGLLLLSAAVGFAQETDSAWYARPWQLTDGLPDNSVNSLAQTADGYIWIGTPSGLVRFDGVRFESESLKNIVANPNRGAIVMIAARAGGLWLAMDRGAVVRLNGAASQAYVQELPDSIPNGLAEDADGTLWIAYRGGAVCRIADGKVTAISPAQAVPVPTDICSLAVDIKGRLWFARAGEVGMARDGKLQTLHRLEVQPMRLAACKDGGMWLCCGAELYKVDEAGNCEDQGAFDSGTGITTVNVLMEDREGAVWAGTAFNGLYRHTEAGWENVPTTHRAIWCLLEDREGNMWAGTFGSGLNQIQRKAITLEGTESGLPFASIQSLCEGQDGAIWAVTQSGALARRAAGKWHTIAPAPDPQSPEESRCVTPGADGRIWVGSRRGVFCWRDGHFIDWNEPEELKDKSYHTVIVSRTGDLWLGQENPGAIVCVRDGKLKTFETPPNSRVIRAMVEDAAGNIWAATAKGVLMRISSDKLVEVSPRLPKEFASIRSLYTTPDGTLWIGYAGWGLGCIMDGHYAEISTDQGLYDDYLSQLVADGDGWLWFGANRGIFKARMEALRDVAEGNATRIRTVHYGLSEGLPSLEGTFGDSPGALRSRDGRLWIPMQAALAVVDPAKLSDSAKIPPTLLTRVSVDDKIVARYAGILAKSSGQTDDIVDLAAKNATLTIPPEHHRIEFEFAALGFRAPENIQCRYRLKNFDTDWIEAGTQRSAPYSRLPNGKYTLEVTACNTAGDWSDTAAQLAIIVDPFFYQTWWFRISALAAFTLTIIIIVRYISFRRLQGRLLVLEQQAALQRERTRIAKDIHDDLGANLTQIAFLGELASQDRSEPDKVADRIHTISGTARQAIKSLDEIVWAVNPRNDTLAHLIDYAGQFVLDYLRLADIRCRLDFPEHIPARELSSDLRHNLFLVVKEAVHNVVKHAGASEVWLRIVVTGEALEISVEDNGRGFEQPPDNPLSDGLRNMRQRMSAIGGTIHLESKPGSGTKIRLRLPWAQN